MVAVNRTTALGNTLLKPYIFTSLNQYKTWDHLAFTKYTRKSVFWVSERFFMDYFVPAGGENCCTVLIKRCHERTINIYNRWFEKCNWVDSIIFVYLYNNGKKETNMPINTQEDFIFLKLKKTFYLIYLEKAR